MDIQNEGTTRKKRSKEVIIAGFEAQIAKHADQMKGLQEKIENIKHPKPRRTAAAKMKLVMAKAKAANMSPEEVAEKLNLSMDD